MAITANSLGQSTKDELLRQLREQLGWSKYSQLVNTYGEDGIIDLILSAEARSYTPQGIAPWKEAMGKSLYVLFFPAFWSAGLDPALWQSWILWPASCLYFCVLNGLGPAGIVVHLVIWLLSLLGLAGWHGAKGPRVVGQGLTWILFLAVLGASAWASLNWLGEGVRMWWKWLGGHF
jgi:hypothetical protein